MKPYWVEVFGNPGSVHSFGQQAIAAVDRSRERIAEVLGAQFEEVLFTSSATEANNLVLQGVTRLYKGEGLPKVIVSAIEHESVLKVAEYLEKSGRAEVACIPVDKEGKIKLASLKKELNERTVLVSVIYGNNEIGTIQDMKKVVEVVKDFRGEKMYPLVHTDAVQAFMYEDIRVNELGVDFMTLSSHKMYGPKGVAALFARRKKTTGSPEVQYGLSPLLYGGGQEFGVRSGTEAVPLIVGMAEAVVLANRERGKEKKRLEKVRHVFLKELRAEKIKFVVNGAKDGLPHILNLTFPKVSAETLLTALDMQGVAASSGAACSMRSLEPSVVLLAIGLGGVEAKSSVRFSFGKGFTEKEVKKIVGILKPTVTHLSRK